ncbi:hypothetical protein RF007C_10155 [Ruminococcus flavefaciens 007c]|uniref:Uncharacterized protein n=1 Tax=Ruminococcus flavefaciens 007c TaxID=1341157 RepID=W7UXC6_RUMFL|nr:hypothetical protein RF007C_10155 [Ruminococcus flavefaciens 007c]
MFHDTGIMLGDYITRTVYTSQLRDSKMKIGNLRRRIGV